jgi:hypothetical protein
VVTLLSCVAVISYTKDNMMIAPALLGAFAGTYVGIVIRKNNNKENQQMGQWRS